MFLGHFCVFLGEIFSQILCPFMNWFFCLCIVKYQEFFTYSGYKSRILKEYVIAYLIRYTICKYSLLAYGLYFQLLHGVFWSIKIFNLDNIKLSIFLLRCQICKKPLLYPRPWKFTSFSSMSFIILLLHLGLWSTWG